MERGDGPSSGEEFFYKLSLEREFQKDLIYTRRKLGIPEKGFLDPKTRQKLWIDDKRADVLGLLGAELSFKKKYQIPAPYWPMMDDYIFFGKPTNALKNKSPVAILSPTKEIEEFYKATGEPFAMLLIFGNATKTKALDFVKNNWREIELTLNINIHKNKRVRVTIHKTRNQAIRELWRKPLKELRSEAGNPNLNLRESLVQAILRKRGLVKKEEKDLSDGNIRKIATQKQSRYP
jgi:hypothetical protein